MVCVSFSSLYRLAFLGWIPVYIQSHHWNWIIDVAQSIRTGRICVGDGSSVSDWIYEVKWSIRIAVGFHCRAGICSPKDITVRPMFNTRIFLPRPLR